MILLEEKEFKLSELLSEFKDEYSYLFFISHHKLINEGLKIKNILANEDGLVIENKNIDRIHQLPLRIIHAFNTMNTQDFIHSIQNLNFHFFEKPILFESDTLIVDFYVDGHLIKTYDFLFKDRIFHHRYSNQKIPMDLLLNKNIEINVKIENLNSSERKACFIIYESLLGKSNEKFYYRFIEFLTKRENRELTEDLMETIRINCGHPKGFFNIFNNCKVTLNRTRLNDVINAKNLDEAWSEKFIKIKKTINNINNGYLFFT